MTLKVHHLRPAPGAHTAKTRVGRGEGSKGKTAGRGTKGTGARGNVSARFEGGQTPLHMRLPKLTGFKSPNKVVFQVVNLDRIAALFPEGGSINPDSLAEAENLSAVTDTATEMSPWPSTLTGWPLRTAPLATRSATVTSPPSG